MEVRRLTGEALDAALDDVARLRIAVFRDWPYIYDGSLEYERRYVQSYRESEAAVVVGAFDGAMLVGAATGTPLEDHADDFAAPFVGTGLKLDDVFYCAESVLLPDYRGQGLGHAFFDHREAHARALGRSHSVFCSVIRPDDHPMKPADYRPLDGFWRKRGYAPMEGVIARFKWTDLGEDHQTEKALQFWGRKL
ncbi:MAG: GNAT family N-acetyltransferase [Thioclava marina]|uniref:GNAT family N-acetyltransferase n=1 Tax=Thioclava TaxID=285107 RepID=UPI000997B653|nr:MULTISPECIES: GNAT family N-acetyltransferase [Thioclava]MBC7145529.1 GNAT family N-acetyltransferase [Thioclava marina]OOY27816.1 GNAT family N-acetyltransferase [Thioclava sp. L04-15]TNE93495.1 MAG: GNAT family N-acetyltransferase [Paracoccaceae bacterium]